MYAFGIIFHEIIARQGPYGIYNQELKYTPSFIVDSVKGSKFEEPFRPPVVVGQDWMLMVMNGTPVQYIRDLHCYVGYSVFLCMQTVGTSFPNDVQSLVTFAGG